MGHEKEKVAEQIVTDIETVENSQFEKMIEKTVKWAAEVTGKAAFTEFVGVNTKVVLEPMKFPKGLLLEYAQIPKEYKFKFKDSSASFFVYEFKKYSAPPPPPKKKLTKEQDITRQKIQALKTSIEKDKAALKVLTRLCKHVVEKTGQCKVCGSYPPKELPIAG